MIPTLPGSLEQLQEKLEAMISKINKLPVERIADNLDSNLVELRKGLVKFNSKTLPGVDSALSDVGKTLQSANTTLQSANSTIAEDSPQREKLGQTLDELSRTARSLRELADYLGRHPESLIRGRPDNAAAKDLK
jgi:paraquat-inducible protein B